MASSENKRRISDKTESERRVRIIQEWILLGYSTSDIVAQLKVTYDIGIRQAYNYYNKAFAKFKEENKHTIEAKKAYHLALRRRLLKDLKEKETPTGARAALRIADSMARMEGLVTSTNNNFQMYDKDDGIATDEDGVAVMRLPDGTEIEL